MRLGTSLATAGPTQVPCISDYLTICCTPTYKHPEDLVAGVLLPPGSYQLVRYEDLVAEPVATLRSLYEVQLDIVTCNL